MGINYDDLKQRMSYFQSVLSKLQRKMDGYKFPVYSTDFCPRNETEWNKRSSLFNCTGEDSTYACFPNDDITQLIEFCYPLQIIAIPPGKNNYEIYWKFISV